MNDPLADRNVHDIRSQSVRFGERPGLGEVVGKPQQYGWQQPRSPTRTNINESSGIRLIARRRAETLCASHSHALSRSKHHGRGFDAVHDVFDGILFGDDAALDVAAVVAVEADGDPL